MLRTAPRAIQLSSRLLRRAATLGSYATRLRSRTAVLRSRTAKISSRTAMIGIGVGLGVALAAPAFAASRLPDPAGTAVDAPATVVSTAVTGPASADLMPLAVTAHQVSIRLNATQLRNAAAIVAAAREMHLPPRAAVIAVATALQESKLHNYGNLGRRNDHDSLGLFQQRPSCGWGTPAQVTDPDHAAKAFLSRLVRIGNWNTIPLTVAAQKVQVSAYGSRYAQWETEAANVVRSDYAAPANR